MHKDGNEEAPPPVLIDFLGSKKLNDDIHGESSKVVGESKEHVSLSLSAHSERNLFRSSSSVMMTVENERVQDLQSWRSMSEPAPASKLTEQKERNLREMKKMVRAAKDEAVEFMNKNNHRQNHRQSHHISYKQKRIDGGYNDSSLVVAALEKSNPSDPVESWNPIGSTLAPLLGLGSFVEARMENPSKRLKAQQEHMMQMMRQMPSVRTTGDWPNGSTIYGFLYRFDEHRVSIVCLCHGSFHTPEEFVKHAGGDYVPEPMKHIIVFPGPF